ncbi:MAG: hypothetical protein JWR68_349 [Polaromonas sp.]|nr:hypothetical protein [Polaromonas sp.]
MYLIVIAWMYVVLMMSIAEATNTTGTVLGALMTFLLYGLGPVTLVIYLMRAPARNKAIKKRNAEALAQHIALTVQHAPLGTPSVEPDAGGHAPGGAQAIPGSAGAGIAPVGKKP